ncbi:MAG: hypothetical protein GQ474_09755, partial [Sulfurimonas sp.]|nr:hypothetical protein [Sulfurimonas sp.]
YTKTQNFTALQDGYADPAVFDTEFTAVANASATKADLASPTLTGTVVIPAAAGGTSPYQKDEVDTALALKAPLASPTFTGSITMDGASSATAPTVSSGDDDTSVATTAHVKQTTQDRSMTSHSATEGADIYTNTTDSDLVLMLKASGGASGGALSLNIGGSNMMAITIGAGDLGGGTIVIPAGETYGFTAGGTSSVAQAYQVKNTY